jgi:amino acid permease
MRASSRPAARWACAALFALTPLGLVVDGIYTLEEPLPHLIGFVLATGIPVLSFLAAGVFLRGIPRWRRFGTWLLLLGSPLTLVLVILFFLTFDQAAIVAGDGVAGLTQRILVLEVLAWFAAMGWLAFRRP